MFENYSYLCNCNLELFKISNTKTSIDMEKKMTSLKKKIIIAFHLFAIKWCLQFKAADTGPPCYLTS